MKLVSDIAKALGWALSLVFLFVSIFTFQVNILAACLLLVSALLCNPLLLNLTKLKVWISLLVVPALLFATYKFAVPSKDIDVTSSELGQEVNAELTDEALTEALESLQGEDVDKNTEPLNNEDVLDEELLLLADRLDSLEQKKDTTKENTITWAESTKQKDLEESMKQESQSSSQTSASTSSSTPTSDSEEPDVSNSLMEVHFVDVGQGDCTLIICDGQAMLIDAGDNSKGTAVQLYLRNHDIERLDYVVGTHPDADHIGGLDVILYKYDCGTVIMPNRSSDTKTYGEVIDTLRERNYSITYPTVGKEYSLGGAKFVIVGPSKEYEDDNNSSVIIRIVHGDNSFLLTADAEEEAEKDSIFSGIDIASTVLKVGHHGSHSSTSMSFLRAVDPRFAVISCGQDNDYGHPHSETLISLKEFGVNVFRTDEQGSIVAISDGKTIKWNCPPSETWKAGRDEEAVDQPGPDVTFVLNTHTMKFHHPDCSSVEDIDETNKKYSYETRDEIIQQGYDPCGNCHP